MQSIYGLSFQDFKDIVSVHGWPSFVARQIADWLYKHHVCDFGMMTNLSKHVRNELSSQYDIACREAVKEQVSTDGTKKYLFPAGNKGFVESAYIPDGKRHTLCVSSQLGCRMGCSFCMTARMGFKGQLSAGEILNQVRCLPERDLLTNIVYMGMGEPFDNLDEVLKSLEVLTADWGFGMSPRRITVSTIGVVPGMKRFLESNRCNLAVSLHSPFEEERRSLVPAARAYPLQNVLDLIRSFTIEKQRRISFEYIVFKDLNHSQRHVKALARALDGIRCRINLLSFHPIPGSSLRAPERSETESFRDALQAKGFIVTIRRSRGIDIQAACGLLSVTNS